MSIETNITEQQELFEALPPMQKKKVAFAIGRYQPPTSGHYKVINKMKEFIRKNPHLNLEAKPVVVVIAGEKSSLDKKKNPLTADERITYMQASGKANGVEFLTSKSAFFALGAIRDAGYEPVAIGAGTDRAKGYKDMLDKGFKTEDGEDIEHVIIPGLDRTEDAVETKKADKQSALDRAMEKLHSSGNLNDDEISGSVARRAVELGYEDEFATIVGLEHNKTLSKMMFKKLQKSFGLTGEEGE